MITWMITWCVYPPQRFSMYMWCDQAKWDLCWALLNLSFVVYMWKHSESFVLLKTSGKSDLRFQRYRQFCEAENKKLQKKFHTIIGCRMYLKINIPDITHSAWSLYICCEQMELICGENFWYPLKIIVRIQRA